MAGYAFANPPYELILSSSVYGLATTLQHRCDGNCEILVAAELFGLTADVISDDRER